MLNTTERRAQRGLAAEAAACGRSGMRWQRGTSDSDIELSVYDELRFRFGAARDTFGTR
jgi:hypothetical protein